MKKLLIIIVILFISLSGFSQSCLPNGIDFINQSQVDNFQSDYPGCTQIEGNVEISGSGITNLNGLNVLTSIGGHLYITNNANLTDISGLSSLAYIGGSLLISTNQSLASLAGLGNVAAINGDVFISNNTVLNDISSLESLNASTASALRITGNTQLAACNNSFICNYLGNPAGKVIIYNNAPGCNNPPEIAGSCGISLPCLPFGDYYFFSQAEVDGFPQNYPGCTDLKGMFHIEGTDVSSLAAFSGLHSIDGTIEIHDNMILTTLEGLNSLALVDGAVSIVRNDILTDISALSQLDTGTISYLVISTNPHLSECDIQSFCAYLAGPFGYSHNNITANYTGCENKDVVLQECMVNIFESVEEEEVLRISPNPASTQITIATPGRSSKFQISIFNTNGQEMLKHTVIGPATVIDISSFPPGVYFVRLQGEKKVMVGKFVRLD